MTIADLLKAKMKAEGLSANRTAKIAGISYQSFTTVLRGEAIPNARSLEKYVRLLRVPLRQLVEAVDESRDKAKVNTLKQAATAIDGARKTFKVTTPPPELRTLPPPIPRKSSLLARGVRRGDAPAIAEARRTLGSVIRALESIQAKVKKALVKL